jgi:hypothetical protein
LGDAARVLECARGGVKAFTFPGSGFEPMRGDQIAAAARRLRVALAARARARKLRRRGRFAHDDLSPPALEPDRARPVSVGRRCLAVECCEAASFARSVRALRYGGDSTSAPSIFT